jgi:hypothetical protein
MKKALLCAGLGSAITGLFYLYAGLPRTGPDPLVVIIAVPLQILARLITKDRTTGEFLYYAMQVVLFSGLSYLILGAFGSLRKR